MPVVSKLGGYITAARKPRVDALSDGPITLDDLAKRIKLKPIACRRLLMMLASLDLRRVRTRDISKY